MGFTSCEMLLWLLFVGFLQASVASSFRGFWDGFENHDASNFQHVSSDQSQPQVEFYQPRSDSLPWPQIQGSKHSPQVTSSHLHPQAPRFQSKPQLPNYWPFPMPHEPVPMFQSSREPGDLPQLPGYSLDLPHPHSPSYQPTPAPQPQQPNQQPQAPGFQALPPNNVPPPSGPLPKLPSRLLENWYQKRPQYPSSRFPSKPLPHPWPQGPDLQRPSTVLHPWSQQQLPAATTQPPVLPTNRPQAPGPLPQSHSKLFHPWNQPKHQLLNYLFKPQPSATQKPPQPPSAPTPQLTPATQQPDPSNNLPRAQPQGNLPHPWYQHLQYQSPIYLLSPHHYPWFLPHLAPSVTLPQPSPAPSSNPPQAPPPSSTTQQPALSTQLPQETGPLAQLPSDTPSPPSTLPYVPDQPLHPWYQHQSPSLVQPHWPLIPGYLPEPVSYQPQYWPYGPSNLPHAWSWYRPQWPIYSPWTSYVPAMQSCNPPLLCYELSSDGGSLSGRVTGSGEPWWVLFFQLALCTFTGDMFSGPV